MTLKSKMCALLTLFASMGACESIASAQGTAFTYQGRLNVGTLPANGSYDLLFALHDSATNGNAQGPILTNTASPVSNGLFIVTLDFGSQFSGSNRWLEVAVETNGGSGFTVLAPRQQIVTTPYAIFAGTSASASVAASASSVAATNVMGTIAMAQLPATVVTNGATGVSISGSFSGNGLGLTNLSSAVLAASGGVTNLATVSLYNRPALTGVALWADPLTITATNNQPLASVPDTSGNGNTLYNGTANQVLYYTAGINGTPGFGFPAIYSGAFSVVAYALTNQLWTPAMNTNSCITMVSNLCGAAHKLDYVEFAVMLS